MPYDASALPVDREDLDAMVEEIQREYPLLARHDFALRRGLTSNDARLLEFTPTWERGNYTPGRHTIEILNNELHGDALKQLVAGEMLHLVGAKDPRTGAPVDDQFRAMKTAFKESLTPRQQAMERGVYNDLVTRGREHRPFDEYLDNVRLDAYIRAGLFPLVNPHWHGPNGAGWTDEQRGLVDTMREHLTNPATPDRRAGARQALEGLKGAPYYGAGGRMEPTVMSDAHALPSILPRADMDFTGVTPIFPRPFERETPTEMRTRDEVMGEMFREPDGSVVPDDPQAIARLLGTKQAIA